jgi:hypothetical protein
LTSPVCLTVFFCFFFFAAAKSATLKAELKQLGFEGTISKDGLEQIYSDASIKNPAEVSEAIGLNEQGTFRYRLAKNRLDLCVTIHALGGVSVEKLISALLLKNTAEVCFPFLCAIFTSND